jgi:hypothetical protein
MDWTRKVNPVTANIRKLKINFIKKTQNLKLNTGRLQKF